MPLFTHTFGLTPQQQVEMPVHLWDLYRAYVDRMNKGGEGG